MIIYPFEFIKRHGKYPDGKVYPADTPEEALKILDSTPLPLSLQDDSVHKMLFHSEEWSVMAIAWNDNSIGNEDTRTGHRAIKGLLIPRNALLKLNPLSLFEQYLLPDLTSKWQVSSGISIDIQIVNDLSLKLPDFHIKVQSWEVLKNFLSKSGFGVCSFATFKLPDDKVINIQVDPEIDEQFVFLPSTKDFVSIEPEKALPEDKKIRKEESFNLWKIPSLFFLLTTLLFIFLNFSKDKPPEKEPTKHPKILGKAYDEKKMDFDGFNTADERRNFLSNLAEINSEKSNALEFQNLPERYRTISKLLKKTQKMGFISEIVNNLEIKTMNDFSNCTLLLPSIGEIKITSGASDRVVACLNLNFSEGQGGLKVSEDSSWSAERNNFKLSGKFTYPGSEQVRLLKGLNTLYLIDSRNLEDLKNSIKELKEKLNE